MSVSPQVKLVQEWGKAFQTGDLDLLERYLHNDCCHITYPRSIDQKTHNIRITGNGCSEPFFNLFVRKDGGKRKVRTSRSYVVNLEKLMFKNSNKAPDKRRKAAKSARQKKVDGPFPDAMESEWHNLWLHWTRREYHWIAVDQITGGESLLTIVTRIRDHPQH